MKTTMTSKGQVTIPAYIRRKLNLKEGIKLDFRITDDNTISAVVLGTSIESLKNVLPKPDKTASVEDMNKAIRKRYAGNRH